MRTAHEIILDPAIRNWVLLPIFLVMFLQGVLRQYVSVLLKDDKKTQLDAISKKSTCHTSTTLDCSLTVERISAGLGRRCG